MDLQSRGQASERHRDCGPRERSDGSCQSGHEFVALVRATSKLHPQGRPSFREGDIVTVDLEDGAKEAVRADMSLFLLSKQDQNYIRKGIRYEWNILLHGPPGTEKTAFIESLSGLFGLDIYRVSLRNPEITDDDLIILFSRARSRCLVVFEDIDQAGLPTRRIANCAGRTTGVQLIIYPHSIMPIKLSSFLNAIDGIATPEGPIVIFTTKYLEALDPAIVRPGRVDKVVRLGLANMKYDPCFQGYTRQSPRSRHRSSRSRFAMEQVRDRSLSPANIQGFLFNTSRRPMKLSQQSKLGKMRNRPLRGLSMTFLKYWLARAPKTTRSRWFTVEVSGFDLSSN